MMKRLIILIMVLTSCALSAVSIRSIRAENYDDAACRLVLKMDRDVDFTVKQQGKDFYLTFSNFDGHIPAYNFSGTFLDKVEPAGAGLKVSSQVQVSYLTMQLNGSEALVIDFLKVTQQKKERLVIARFLSDKGRLASADKEFHRLAIDYKDHYDILYYWGELLIKRGSSRAAEKLALIPKSSSYYAAAQELLQPGKDGKAEKPKGKPEPKPIQEETELQPPAKTDQELLEQPLQDSIIVATRPEVFHQEKPNFLSSLAELASANILLTIVVFVAILVLLGILIFGSFKKSAKKSPLDIEENRLGLDTDTLCKMVNRLLSDGWTNKEIARELKISQHEVELIVRRLHYMEICEDDVKE